MNGASYVRQCVYRSIERYRETDLDNSICTERMRVSLGWHHIASCDESTSSVLDADFCHSTFRSVHRVLWNIDANVFGIVQNLNWKHDKTTNKKKKKKPYKNCAHLNILWDMKINSVWIRIKKTNINTGNKTRSNRPANSRKSTQWKCEKKYK